MIDDIVWLVDALNLHSPGHLATMVDEGMLRAYDRFDRFGAAKQEQKEQALNAIAAYATAMSGPHAEEHLLDLEWQRGYPDSILTTAGFLRVHLLKARPKTGDGSLQAEIAALKMEARDARVLQEFHAMGGRRPSEREAGRRGALTELAALLGKDDKNLAQMLDRALKAIKRPVRSPFDKR